MIAELHNSPLLNIGDNKYIRFDKESPENLDVEKIKDLCQDQIRLVLTVFDENLKKDVFKDQNLKIEDFIEIAREKFMLEKDNSILLAKYIFNSSHKSQHETRLEFSSDFIEQKLKEFASIYKKLNSDYIKTAMQLIVENLNSNDLKNFLFKLQNLQKLE